MKTQIHERWLAEITALPTAAGHEANVIQWIENWVAERSDIAIKYDQYGNMLLTSTRLSGEANPVVFTAHMDHPAFVVVEQQGDTAVLADFRGGVHDDYFNGAPVLLHQKDQPPIAGRVTELRKSDDVEADKQALIAFDKTVEAAPGQIITWDTGQPRIDDGMFYAPACDDLAGLTAALAAFDQLRDKHQQPGEEPTPRVHLLFTRCEEVGFIGAIGSCVSGLIPADAWVINLECSKSIPRESPLGAGPIVRIGDRTSSFDPELMYRLSHIARELAAADEDFRFQRKLMPGGTCEASAFLTFGYRAGCICLALGRYHNMNETTGRIDAESISLADFHHLVQLLVAAAPQIQRPDGPNLRDRLEKLFDRRRPLVEADPT